MERFYRYKDNQYDIKLIKTGTDIHGRPEYIPIAGLNKFTKQWYEEHKNQLIPNVHWSNLTEMKSTKHSFICKRPCNSPGDKVR